MVIRSGAAASSPRDHESAPVNLLPVYDGDDDVSRRSPPDRANGRFVSLVAASGGRSSGFCSPGWRRPTTLVCSSQLIIPIPLSSWASAREACHWERELWPQSEARAEQQVAFACDSPLCSAPGPPPCSSPFPPLRPMRGTHSPESRRVRNHANSRLKSKGASG